VSAFYATFWVGIHQGLQAGDVQLLGGSGHALFTLAAAGRQCLCEKVLGRVLMMSGLSFGRRELEKESATEDLLLLFGWMIG
jgi:hypothetical protein